MAQAPIKSATPTYRVLARVVTAVLLGAVAVLTGVASVLGLKVDIGTSENRRLATLAPASIGNLVDRDYFQGLNTWANDHQALRAPLIGFHSLLKLKVFGAALDDKTIIGRDGFYFYGMASMRRDYERLDRFTDDPDYVREVLAYLRALEAWSNQTGRRVLFVVTPNKHNIYPEKYNPSYVHGGGPGTADVLESWLTQHIPAMAAPIGLALRQAAREQLVYYRTDTHWNGWGALAAANAIAERLETVEPLKALAPPAAAVTAEPEIMNRGNFADLMGLPLSENLTRPIPRGGFTARDDSETRQRLLAAHLPDRPRLFTVMRKDDAPQAARLLMLGDSFMSMIVPYLAERFSTSVFYNAFGEDNAPAKRFPQDLIKAVDPDVVIVQLVERRVRPCRATSKRPTACAETLIGDMASNMLAARLESLARRGTVVASGLAPRVSGEDWVLSLPAPFPATKKLLLRVTTDAKHEGRLRLLSKRVPKGQRGEPMVLQLSADKPAGLMIAMTNRAGEVITLTPEGGLDAKTTRFDVIAVDDDTNPATVSGHARLSGSVGSLARSSVDETDGNADVR